MHGHEDASSRKACNTRGARHAALDESQLKSWRDGDHICWQDGQNRNAG
jgi:hypothetical protein